MDSVGVGIEIYLRFLWGHSSQNFAFLIDFQDPPLIARSGDRQCVVSTVRQDYLCHRDHLSLLRWLEENRGAKLRAGVGFDAPRDLNM
jgi:hypothetical protein